MEASSQSKLPPTTGLPLIRGSLPLFLQYYRARGPVRQLMQPLMQPSSFSLSVPQYLLNARAMPCSPLTNPVEGQRCGGAQPTPHEGQEGAQALARTDGILAAPVLSVQSLAIRWAEACQRYPHQGLPWGVMEFVGKSR